ncbi:MAG: AAA family ATPase [Nitrosomonas sp.]|uniref:ATP-dependent nuclease n=1 Tax=Nitrosomonas sp. TaxID=42353 RepID=UPI0025E4380F|nr:AAA family ATPase [Nitrosomonas sp.]MBY0475363.1 AAA family ATPase [Nitrosomonas sp.]
MKLLKVTIHNFRGIVDATISFQKYSLLVGANNAGKSTIIDCIRAFYEKDGYKYKKENDFPLKGAQGEESWIELEFYLTAQEQDSLKEEYQGTNNQLKVRKYFQTNVKLHDGKNASGSILGYLSNGDLSKEPFYGAKNVQNGKFGDLIYIPAISKVDEHTKLTGPSALRDLITNIMSDVVENSNAYTGLTNSVSKFAAEIRDIETADKRSLSGFEIEINKLLSPWQTKFNLKFATPSATEIIKSMLSWDIRDDQHEKPQSIEYFGSGFQRHFIYTLIQLGAKYVPQKATKKMKDFSPSLNLVLFEEPEAFLHPPQQNDLARSLIKISDSEDWQIVCSTHSAYFVSRNADQIPSIIRTQRKNGITSTFQVNKEIWQSIINSNKEIGKIPEIQKRMHLDDSKDDMEALKYFLWLNPDRSGVFFAQQVLLVEGPSETVLINKLLDDNKLTLPHGTYVLDCLGKYNIHRFMNLLNSLGVTHSVLHDDDTNTNEHKGLNQLIQESTNSRLTKAIKQIPDNLEKMLGLPPNNSPHRKPQHILFCYTSNQIGVSNLNSFCKLVESCFVP